MNAEIVAIGTELLLGVTVDTNSAYLAQQLATIGVPVQRVTLVRDDLDEIVAVLRGAMERVQLVICSGGLGPTGDDLTREAIARATERPLEFHQTLLDDIAARFASFKRTMSESNRQQAYVPQGAHIIRNPRGTAPSFVVEHSASSVAALPGVPQELHYLTENALLPYLRQHHGLEDVLLVREVRVTGLSEAEAGERIADIMLGTNPIVGITAKRGQHTIRIAATGKSPDAVEALIQPLLQLIDQRFAGHLLGSDTLEQRVGRLLNEHGVRLALVESDVAAPVYRALTQTPQGRDALAVVTLGHINDDHSSDYEHLTRSIIANAAATANLCIAIVTERGSATYRTVHFALGPTGDDGEILYVLRGFDFGLPQASDFVATTALDLLRRHLERASSNQQG